MDKVCTARWTRIGRARPLAARTGAGLELLQRPRRTHRHRRRTRPAGVLRCGAAAAGPEGERRTTSAGRPAGLRLTTQWHRGNPTVGSSPSRPWRASPRGRHPEPGRSRTVRAVAGPRPVGDGGTTIRGRPLGRLLRGAFLVPGPGFPQPCPHVHRLAAPERVSRPPGRAVCPVQSTEVVPTLCTATRSARGDEPACCGQRVHATVDDGTRPGAAAVPPRGGPDRERRVTRPSRAAAASGPRGPRGCGARPG